MTWLGIDPGLRPGYCLRRDGATILLSASASALAPTPLTGIAVEGQWRPRRRGRAAPIPVQDILALAIRAGVQAGRIAGSTVPIYVLDPGIWRKAIGVPNDAAVSTNHIRRSLSRYETLLLSALRLTVSREADVLAAIGIAKAAERLFSLGTLPKPLVAP